MKIVTTINPAKWQRKANFAQLNYSCNTINGA
jgi:hypothetical protein